MKAFDYDGFMNESNRIMQRSHDETYNEGIERMRSLVKRFCRPTDLEREVKTVIFNGNGNVSPDAALQKVLTQRPAAGLYDALFGKEED